VKGSVYNFFIEQSKHAHAQTADLIKLHEVVISLLLILLTVALQSVCRNVYDDEKKFKLLRANLVYICACALSYMCTCAIGSL
jgi:hypothetical protein